MNITINYKDDFFTKAANLARKAWNNPFVSWPLVLGLLVSLVLIRMELGDYKNAIRNCGMKLEVIEKAYNVTE